MHINLGNYFYCPRYWNGQYWTFYFQWNNKFEKIFSKNKKRFIILSFLIGISLFLGSALQQIALLYTDVANAAFFTIFYVPMVPIIVFFLFKEKIHWSNWPSVILCLLGGYLLTNFYDATIRKGDALVVLCAVFWLSLIHI